LLVIGTEFIDRKTVLFLENLVDGQGVLWEVFLFGFLLDVDGDCHLDEDFLLDVDWNLSYDGLGGGL
jgi:hypothetical protein